MIERDLESYKASLTEELLQVINNLHGLSEAAVGPSIMIRQLVIGVFSSWFVRYIFSPPRTIRNTQKHEGEIACISYKHLYDCAKKNDFSAFLLWGTFEELATTHELQAEDLRNCASKVFGRMLPVFQRSPFFSSHEPLEVDNNERDDLGGRQAICPRYWANCEREAHSPCRLCEGDSYFTYMDPCQVLPEEVWSSVPEPPELPLVYTTPATASYQKALGLKLEHLLPKEGWSEIRHLTDIFESFD